MIYIRRAVVSTETSCHQVLHGKEWNETIHSFNNKTSLPTPGSLSLFKERFSRRGRRFRDLKSDKEREMMTIKAEAENDLIEGGLQGCEKIHFF